MNPTHAPTRRTRTTGDVARGLAATLALAGFVLGVPAALSVVAPLRWPQTWPTWDTITTALSRPDDGTLFLGAVTLVAWGAWAAFTLSVLTELAAATRHITVPAIPLLGVTQRAAATLITAAGLLVATSAPILSTPTAHAAVLVDTAPEHPAADSGHSSATTASGAAMTTTMTKPPTGMTEASAPIAPTMTKPSTGTPTDRHPVITVARGDTLWSLAERHLGNGARYTEIRDLNLGHPQPDGRTLTDDHWIYPDWQLRLPLDAASVPTPKAATAASTVTLTPAPATVHDVVAGDTLWNIAAQHLGDGARYREIYDLNTHTLQPDGRTLTDPDVIRPGWHLTIPSELATPVTPPIALTSDAESTQASTASGRSASAPVADAKPEGTARAVEPSAQVPVPPQTASVPSDAATQREEVVVDTPFTRTLVLGLTALAATGVAGELARRRRRQHRLRRAGERIPMPAPGSQSEATERSLRRAEVPLTLDSLRHGLHLLGPACRAADRTLPRVGAILITDETIDLVLVEDDEDPVAPFASIDARTWRATHTELVDQLDAPDLGLFPHPFPALVTVGIAGEATTVLLNLEAAGVLSVNGSLESVTATMRALACELATSPLTAGAQLVLGPEYADLAAVSDPMRVRNLDSITDLDQRSGATGNVNREVLTHANMPDALQARSMLTGDDTWTPTVFVGANQATTTTAWSGHAILTTDHSSPWHLEVDNDGDARLEPFGFALRAQRLPEDHYRQLIRVLGDAAEDTIRTETAPPASVESQLVEVLAAVPAPSAPARDSGDTDVELSPQRDQVHEPPRVLVLGPVTITGLDTQATSDRSRRNVELVAFLALHPGASAEQVDEVLGHGKRIEPPNRNAHISRARTWLGTAADGRPYLMKVANHDHYRLDPAIHTDWDDFLNLSTRGLEQGQDGAPDLRAALALVRGRPFTGTARSAYEWADALTHEMIETITDVAHALALIETDARNNRGARHATAIGLTVDPCNEQLFRDAITAAHNAGDHDEVERLVDKLQARIEAIDPGCDLEDETLELLEALQLA